MAPDRNDAEAFDPLDPNGTVPGQVGRDRSSAASEASRPGGLPEPGEAEAGQLIADIDLLQRERDDLLETTQRLQADFENYRKRVLREQTALVERAAEGIVEQLLPVLDSFQLALANLDGEVDLDRVRKGIELVYAELIGVLERAGLEPIVAVGAPFDPNEHEAVMQDDGDGEPRVGEVLRAGWKLKGRVLRPAMVKVVR
jgi:molecular chaperone GrpE